MTLKNYLKQSKNVKLITEEAMRAGFICDTIKETEKESLDKNASEIIKHCNLLNIKKISELDKLLSGTIKYSYYLFTALYEKDETDWVADLSFFILLIIIYENLENIKNADFLENEGWHPQIAENVMEVIKNFNPNK